MKKILNVRRNVPAHWVGDGFPVRSLISYQEGAETIDPFLLLDYAGPAEFPPANQPRGVGEHPHRGFETVTIVYQGELEHRDSGGNHGTIGAGDVQWMTAAAGVIHEEFHSHAFTRSGGTLEMVQLWVNLPAKDKLSSPRYQEIVSKQIPTIELPNNAGTVRVIAGEFANTRGPAKTFTPVNLWDCRLKANHSAEITVPAGYTTIVVVQRGSVTINGAERFNPVDLVILDRAGERFSLDCHEDAMVLVLSGLPLNEPVVGRGPFVMNTREQIEQAMRDYQAGRMGSLSQRNRESS
jgi:redox-sensitive bicupin YhaK (pirin superfamily)